MSGWNYRHVKYMENFCRVFEIPAELSEETCFRGPVLTTFYMVDWFQPITQDAWAHGSELPVNVNLAAMEHMITAHIEAKKYYRKDRAYLVLCDFAYAFMIPAQIQGSVIDEISPAPGKSG